MTVDIALPVLNEERTLETSLRVLQAELSSRCPYRWSLSIVDNGSSDSSWTIASRIARTEPNVRALRLAERGRGGALKAAWTSSPADILAYMDIDLSTDLEALGPVLDPIAAGTADISIGSRLASNSQVTRSVQREAISHLYNLIARAMLRYSVRDAQCGFKAVSRSGPDDRATRSGQQLVLRYRVAGPGHAPWNDGSTRCPSTGSRTTTRGYESSARPSMTFAASGD